MSHVTSRLAAYLAGELTAQQRDEVARHLETCEACRREYEAQAAVWGLLETVAEPEPSAASVWPAVRLRTIAAENGNARPALGWAAAALAAGIILGMAWPGGGARTGDLASVGAVEDEDSWLQSSWLQRDTGDDLAAGWLLAGLDENEGGGGS